MADLAPRLRVWHPVGQQLVRILVAVRQTQGNAGQVTDKRRRQGVLAVHGEDDSRVEAASPKPIDHLEFRRAVTPRSGRLHPRGVIDDYVVYLGNEGSYWRSGRRGQQRDVA